jgi:hypothetical protein
MKTLIKISLLKIVLFLVVYSFATGCSKSKHDNVDPTPVITVPAAGTGYFYAGGIKYSGKCDSLTEIYGVMGFDVTISTGVINDYFIIYNMPMQSSLGYNIDNAITAVGVSSRTPYILALFGNPRHDYYSTGGSIEKVSANSFTFSCTMKSDATGQIITVRGAGAY